MRKVEDFYYGDKVMVGDIPFEVVKRTDKERRDKILHGMVKVVSEEGIEHFFSPEDINMVKIPDRIEYGLLGKPMIGDEVLIFDHKIMDLFDVSDYGVAIRGGGGYRKYQ